MGEIIVVFMALMLVLGLGVVVRDALDHTQKKQVNQIDKDP